MADQLANLGINPFLCLNYEFGMLLGKDDFVTDQGYHRGKTWLHNAWLHREGVVWGYAVSVSTERSEIAVGPGLALAPGGQELALLGEVCVNVPLWLEKHRNDAGFVITVPEDSPGTEVFDAHITLGPAQCLARPVPSITESCGDPSTAGGVAFSRVSETVEIRLVPGPPPNPAPAPYHRLRLLFGLEQALTDPETGNAVSTDQEVLDARNAVLAQPESARASALLDAFRRFAAMDVVDLSPFKDPATGEASLTPLPSDASLVIASLTGLAVATSASGAALTAGTVDVSVRTAHVATRTIQELLCGPVSGSDTAAAQGPHVAGGPTIVDDSNIRATFDGDIEPATLTDRSVFVATRTRGPWEQKTVAIAYDAASKEATITVAPPMAADALVRLRIVGTGDAPVIGANGFPLAGPADSPLGSASEGSDFVWMTRRGA